MTTTRQDAWTQDEDLLLAEVVLRHIRDGGTQLAAFEEVGRKLSRTAAACGFRWNSHVRKQYKTGIELAKKQRKEGRKQPVQSNVENEPELKIEVAVAHSEQSAALSLNDVIQFLQQFENDSTSQDIQLENEELCEKVIGLEKKVEKLIQEKQSLVNHLQVVEEDYHALTELMDRARKMVVLQEDERNRKVKFQMDRNGNLERVEK
ncbi:sporulation-specific transcriptional regulator GerR [Metabacillus herbersteinensis]|uniref:Sporulation-specific transcriptional regulator GerR n=1 Tax=Metabacillus herbersteinensis TaxID=283816 RepID=A0ABV6GD91_9BACI